MKTKRSWALSTRVAALLAALYVLALAAVVAGIALMAREDRRLLGPHALPLWVLLAALLAFGWVAYRHVLVPYARVRDVLDRFLDGRTVDSLFALPYALTPELPRVLDKLSEALDKQAQLKNEMKQAEFLALQNQINPHFLYNTLEAIRGDALLGGMETIADVAESLAVYFRYTISKMDQLVTLADELHNVRSYFAIQKYRYGERVDMRVLYDPEDAPLLDCRLPKLTLQPIVENAITHGLEPNVGPGCVTIRFEGTKSRLIITISDDGVGVDQLALESLLARLSRNTPAYEDAQTRRGGIALVNVSSRLRLLFGEQYGLTITSTPGLGTDVTITLPRGAEGRMGGASGDA